jgi:hypothetical protein
VIQKVILPSAVVMPTQYRRHGPMCRRVVDPIEERRGEVDEDDPDISTAEGFEIGRVDYVVTRVSV